MGLRASKTNGERVKEEEERIGGDRRTVKRRVLPNLNCMEKFVFRRKTFLAMQLSYRVGKKLILRLLGKQALGALQVIGGEIAVRREVSEAADETAHLSGRAEETNPRNSRLTFRRAD